MKNKDYYSVLGLEKTASEDDIKKAYREAAKKYHPDRNAGDQEMSNKFTEAAEAYEVLSDPEKRRSYDAVGSSDYSHFNPFSNIPNAEDIFNSFFGGARRQVDNNIQLDLEIGFLEAIRGCQKEVSIYRQDQCQTCSGSGIAEVEKCSACNGIGHKTIKQDPWVVQHQMCNRCGGKGTIVTKNCDDCKGQGVAGKEIEHKLTIDVPAGVDSGMKLRIRGHGKPSKNGVGDLHVTIEVEEHPYFRRDGVNIYYQLPVTFAELSLGKNLEVPTLEENTILEIPKGTQPGTPLSLWGLGVPDVKNPTVRGDLVFVVHLDMPEPMPDEYRTLIDKMAELDEKYKTVDKKTHESILTPL